MNFFKFSEFGEYYFHSVTTITGIVRFQFEGRVVTLKRKIAPSAWAKQLLLMLEDRRLRQVKDF